MDDKKAAEILIKLADKYPLNDEEKKAVRSAAGVLGWTALGKSRIKAKKDKMEKSMEW